MSTRTKDLLIIGAGAVGLYGWYCANLVGLTGYIIEAHTHLGGQVLTAMAIQREIRDLPCIPMITGMDIYHKLREQIDSVPTSLILISKNDPVVLKQHPHHFAVTLRDQQVLLVKNIIIASGNGAFEPRMWTIKKKYRNVISVLDPSMALMSHLRGKKVTILGGGDGALNTVLELAKKYHPQSINLIHKRTFLRAKKYLVEQARAFPNINWWLGYQLIDDQVVADVDLLKTIYLMKSSTQKKVAINSDYFIIQYGTVINLKHIINWPIKMTDDNKIIIDQQCQTNITHLYAAGDVAYYYNKMYSLQVGFGEIANAVNNILQRKQTDEQKQSTPLYFGDYQPDK